MWGCHSDIESNTDISGSDADPITFISYKLNIDTIAAEAVLDKLGEFGPTDTIPYIVKSVDYNTGEDCYVVWLENGSVSLYMDGENIKAAVKGVPSNEKDIPQSSLTTQTTSPTVPVDTSAPIDTTAFETEAYGDDSREFVADEPEHIVSSDDLTEPCETGDTLPAYESDDDNRHDDGILQDTEAVMVHNVCYSTEVIRGEKGFFSIKGNPEAIYRLDVFYPSGKSSAKGLGEITADKYGNAYWEWRVSSATAVGTHKIRLTCGENEIEYDFTVLPKPGESQNESASSDPPSDADNGSATDTLESGYVINLSSKKLHLPSCKYAKSMSEKNRGYIESREKAIELGYVPCKVCCP